MSLGKQKKQLDAKIDVIIPKKVNDQIKYLCKEINRVEWSGVLFYTMEGSIQDPKNCVMTLQEILPLDKGTSGATSYEIGLDVVKYMIANDAEEKGWKIGHIHSHHNMSVFFSGTDDSELQDNSESHNFYLSVIVNNKHEIIGKVGITALANLEEDSEKELGFVALDEDGEEYFIESLIKPNSKKFFEYNCNIKFDSDVFEVSDEFKELMTKMKTNTRNYSGEYGYGRGTNPSYRGYGSSKIYGSQSEEDAWEEAFNYYSNNSKAKTTSINRSAPTVEEKANDFAFELLADGDDDCLKLSSIEDILDYYVVMEVDGDILSNQIMKNYKKLSKKIFPDDKARPEYYLIRKTIEAYQEEMNSGVKDKYNLLQPVVAKLKAKHELMLNKLKEDA